MLINVGSYLFLRSQSLCDLYTLHYLVSSLFQITSISCLQDLSNHTCYFHSQVPSSFPHSQSDSRHFLFWEAALFSIPSCTVISPSQLRPRIITSHLINRAGSVFWRAVIEREGTQTPPGCTCELWPSPKACVWGCLEIDNVWCF